MQGRCGFCDGTTELFILPGRFERHCFPCSADVATTILLSTEINAGRLQGWHVCALECALAEVNERMLARLRQSNSSGVIAAHPDNPQM
jgi:hypothetical protein